MKVLIIEDDIALAGTIKNYLKLKGLDTYHTNNGATGIQMAFELQPDAVVCDINIPVIDGYQVFKILNETRVTQQVPFLFLTAKTELSEIREGMKLGADDYITKPFDLKDLYDSIITRIEKREKLLKMNEDKFLTLLNNEEHATFICQKNKFVVTNQKMVSLFGINQVELEKKSLVDLAVDSDKEKIENTVGRCISEHHKEITLEFMALHNHNKPLSLKLVGGFSFYNGQPCMVGYLINLTGGQYTLNDISLSKTDLNELGKAIELFSADYNYISKELVEKLSKAFLTEKDEPNDKQSDRLTLREKEVLNEICLGKSTSEIAQSLFISESTIEKHRASILIKTNSKNMIEAVIYALKHHLINV